MEGVGGGGLHTLLCAILCLVWSYISLIQFPLIFGATSSLFQESRFLSVPLDKDILGQDDHDNEVCFFFKFYVNPWHYGSN